MLLQEVREEENLQHHEDDEELDEDDGPQCLAQAHVPESVGVKVIDPKEESLLVHRRRSKDVANIRFFPQSSKLSADKMLILFYFSVNILKLNKVKRQNRQNSLSFRRKHLSLQRFYR